MANDAAGAGATTPSDVDEITVTIRMHDPHGEHRVKVTKTTRAAALKALVETASGVPASTQRLLCRGRVLADETSMESARVEDGDTLLLVQRAPDAATGAGAAANPNLARDPHAPDNVERRAAGRQGTGGVASIGNVGELSGLITQLLANAAPMVGGMPAHAMTLEFSIGAAPTPTPGATFGFARGDAQAAAVVASAAAAAAAEHQVDVNSEDVLRRFVATLEHTIETVRASAPEMPPPAQNVGAASTPESEANAAEEEGASRGATHYGVQCDACNLTPVRGSRYKSVAHEDFDLCQACFTSGRGAARGPFARLDLPLPSGLPPIVINPNADNNDNAQQNPTSTPRERSEVALGGLGEMLRSAAALARASAPLLDDVAERFSPATRANTVYTQARGLQLATVMQSVGSLWCELARAVAVVPPPPGSGTTNANVDAGDVDYEDDVNAPRSLFAYPRLAHIAPSGTFPHTRPPGMPLHNSSTFLNGEPVPTMMTTTGRLAPAGVHIIATGPEYEGVDNLPAPVQNMLRRHMRAAEGLQQQQRQQQQQQQRQQQPSEPAPSAPPGMNANDAVTAAAPRVRAPPTIAGGESATQGHETHSNRALSRFLGSMLRVIPSPSFTRTAAAPSADATRRAHDVRSMLTSQTRAPTTTTTATTTAATTTAAMTTTERAAGEASPSSPTRRSTRRRSPDQSDAEHSRAAKSSKVDDKGKSPAAAAAAARRVRDKENEDATSSKPPVAGSSRGIKSKDATTEK